MTSTTHEPLTAQRCPPRNSTIDSIIVLCHGYGANGADLIGLADAWQNSLPSTLFLAPDAPEICPMPDFPGAPQRRQWFSTTPPFMVSDAADALAHFVEAELQHNQIEPHKLALVGFSQGTMVALHYGLYRLRPAAILGYSGALVETKPLSHHGRPVVKLIHGSDDVVVPPLAMTTAEKALKTAGIAVTTHLINGLGHGIDAQGVDLGRQFLTEHLSS